MKPAVIFNRFAASKDRLDDLARVEALIRRQFHVDPAELVLVSEDPGAKPGYPPFETNVVFWIDTIRYRLRVFAPVDKVMADDLPIGWLLPSLEDNGENECC